MHKKNLKYIFIGIYFAIAVVWTIGSSFFTLSPLLKSYFKNKIINAVKATIPVEVDNSNREFISDFKSGNSERISALMMPEYTPNEEQIKMLSKFLANIDESSGNPIYSDIGKTWGDQNSSGRERYDVTYEFLNNDPVTPYMDVRTLFIRTATSSKYKVFYVQLREKSALEEALERDNKFDFVKTLLAILFPVLVTITAIAYLKQSSRPRWWVLLIILLAGMSFSFGPSKEEAIKISIPIGALIYWIARNKILAKEQLLASKQEIVTKNKE